MRATNAVCLAPAHDCPADSKRNGNHALSEYSELRTRLAVAHTDLAFTVIVPGVVRQAIFGLPEIFTTQRIG